MPTATDASSTTTAAPAQTTTAVPVQSTPAAATTTTGRTAGPGAACPSSPLPANLANVTTASGSFVGDGQPDVLKAYQAVGNWHLRVELSAGGQVDVTVPDIGAGDAVKAVGGFNIDSTIADEIFATVGSGGYSTLVGNTLVLANTSPPQVLAANDLGLTPYGTFTCGGLTLPV